MKTSNSKLNIIWFLSGLTKTFTVCKIMIASFIGMHCWNQKSLLNYKYYMHLNKQGDLTSKHVIYQWDIKRLTGKIKIPLLDPHPALFLWCRVCFMVSSAKPPIFLLDFGVGAKMVKEEG